MSMARNKQRTIARRLTAAVLSFITALSLLPWDGGLTAYAADTSSPIELKRIGGSGEAFIYHSFAETTVFEDGVTYAFLDGIYDEDDAVSALGAGAILKAVSKNNRSQLYIVKKYGESAEVKTYVAVITPGKDFDSCLEGGLYQVPNTSSPTAYRYFCSGGGAQNCGPYYAYTYVEESITCDKVSASLKDITKQGSNKSSDYTVSISYNEDQTKTLDPGSYTVSFTAPNTVTFVISDSVGKSVTANFESPLAVRYDGNAEGVSGVPATQAVWKGNSVQLSATEPTRAGYTLANWKDKTTGTAYSAGATISPTASLNLLAQWRDSQTPTVTYSPTQVMTGDTDDSVKKAVQAALTITDNEPVSECTTTITLPADFTKTPGSKNISVTVADAAGNRTIKTCSVYVASYVSFGTPTVMYTSTAGTLKATLKNPGTDTVTESGFVWGVMNSPTLTVNNGKAATSTAVKTAGGTISVTASNLQKGVTYYARAYITAGNITYYSDEISIGLGLPAYGTFTIKNNNNNTFTVTRTGGSEGAQTVYYRTVNGSAVGGTHFTHKYGTLTFAAGVTTQTITITEKTANTAYSTYTATAYSNANRTYSVEIYRVTGGGSLGTTTKATRTMTSSDSYEIDRKIYSSGRSKEQNVKDDNNYVVDRSGTVWTNDNLYWRNNRGYNQKHNQDNFNTSANINDSRYSASEVAYIKGTGITDFLYRYTMIVYECEDAWEHAWMGTHEPYNAHSTTKCSGSYTSSPISLNDSNAGEAIWTAVFDAETNKQNTKNFPVNSNTNVTGYKATGSIVTVDGTCYAEIPIGDTVYNFFGATGSGEDRWRADSFTDYIRINDTAEPQLVAVAPMAGGTYGIGDTFVVSLIFDEIVDSTNSTLSSVSVNTTWGTAKYSGGANTNVLYFTGTVATNASSPLKVNSITGASYIKDMCNSTTVTPTASGSGTTSATLDTGMPSFTVTAGSISNGTGKATIKVTGTQAKTTGMSYAWSDSTAVPASGWVTLTSTELTTAKSTSGLTLSIRKEAGSGASNGKWYLHVKGEYSGTGYMVYKTATLDFGTAASPASGSTQPTLTVNVVNTNWATSRTIYYSYTPATGVTLQYRTPGSTTWTTPTSKTQASFTRNGWYTFLLTAGDETITKAVEVTKIDRTVPTASIGTLTSDSVETQKSGVYTRLVLPIAYADAGSGVKSVQYAWTNSAGTPASGWTTLATGAAAVTYTATETTPTTKYLHIKVTDNVGLTKTARSQAYTVISETAAKSHAPTITLTGNPTAWQNDTATLEWKLTNYSGKQYEVILPDGKTSEDSSGEIWARQNGTYTVTVRDLDYGGENSATVTVTKLDFDPPDVTVSGIKNGWWKDSYSQTMTVNASDSQSGVGKKWYKIVSSAEESPTEGLTEFTNNITVTAEGSYYIYWKVYDNAGEDSEKVQREGNYTEGFQPVQIDTTAPTVSFGEYSADEGLPVKASDATSKLASVEYTVFNSITEETKNGTVSVSGLDSKEFDITADQLSPGDNYITVTATDNAGNTRVSEAKMVHVDIISVDITWGALAFTYSDGMWSPETHDYEGRGWKANETDGDKITVTNNGEVEVSVTYSYTSEIRAVAGSFTDGTDTVTEVTLPKNGTQSAQLCLSGKPGKTLNSEKIGSVTVTIGGE